jgi:hypothetical protein
MHFNHIVIITDVDKMREYATLKNIRIPDNVSRGGLFCRGCGGYLHVGKMSADALATYSKDFRRQHNRCLINTATYTRHVPKRAVDRMYILS